jgi:cytosine/adenosine deaminase-related metal-dependent hydrolase
MSSTHPPLRILHTAELLLPMAGQPPIRDAGVIVDDEGTILEVGPFTSLRPGYDMRYAHSVLMPGVLNCHIHLADAGRGEPVSGGKGLVNWVGELLAKRSEESQSSDTGASQREQLRAMREAGTVAIGEVSNDLGALDAIRDSGLRCRLMHELIGFRKERAGQLIEMARQASQRNEWNDSVAYTVASHAPYSVSPELMREIESLNDSLGTFTYQHLAEDPDERLLYESASGPWRPFLERIGAWEPTWEGSGLSPIEYYDRAGLLNERFVAVHLADATQQEIELLARRGVMAILSPTSNLHITGKLPDLETIVRSGMTFAFGTDGRGSNPSVDVFDEAKVVLEHWPDLRPGLMLEALTTAGSTVLQFGDMGHIAVGNRPGLNAITVKSVTDDLRKLESAIVCEAVSRTRVS